MTANEAIQDFRRMDEEKGTADLTRDILSTFKEVRRGRLDAAPCTPGYSKTEVEEHVWLLARWGFLASKLPSKQTLTYDGPSVEFDEHVFWLSGMGKLML
ncbi:MAG: hypothetical protein OXN89_10580 [Bryobacterales bacterium]|nr:hypothetical protein [Bryobacterales bacterium]